MVPGREFDVRVNPAQAATGGALTVASGLD